MTIILVLIFSIIGSIGAIITAAIFLMFKRKIQKVLIPCLISYATGTLLTAALLGMIPKAISDSNATFVLLFVLIGIIFFFLLEKTVIWHHCHDEECSIQSAAGPILLIGDSVVYGLGIKFNETFAYRLQQISNYDIINAGVGGWNTQNEYLWLKHEGISFDPDIVVLFITSNDHDNVYAGKIPKYTRFQRMIYRSYVLSTMFYIKRGLFSLILGRSTIKEIGEDSYKIAEESLQGIIDFVGDRLIVCMYGTTQTVQQTKVMRFYLDILKENKIPCFFLPDKIYENRISRIDGHLNAKGHRMISQVLYAVLKQYENFVDH